jgi:signal transduction histidine kinase
LATACFSHDDCAAHLTPQGHPEQVARLQAVERGLAGLPLLRMDPNQMKQAFYNLIKNALQAMGTGGSLTIVSDLTEYDALISFEDTGKGMSPETVAAMHDPWFTTKKTGTGLGMLIVRRIVRDHGGELTIESEEGKGTRVAITLPRGPRPGRYLEAPEDVPRRKPVLPDVIDV